MMLWFRKRCVDIYCIRMYNKDVDLHTSCKLDFQNLSLRVM